MEACGAVRSLTKEIYAPDVGETIQIGQHTNSYSVSLSEELLASVTMSNVRTSDHATCTCTFNGVLVRRQWSRFYSWLYSQFSEFDYTDFRASHASTFTNQ